MKAAVTGVRDLPDGGEKRIVKILSGLTFAPEEFTTGAQFGADTAAAEIAFGLWPETLHRVVVPAHRHNNDLVALAERLGKETRPALRGRVDAPGHDLPASQRPDAGPLDVPDRLPAVAEGGAALGDLALHPSRAQAGPADPARPARRRQAVDGGQAWLEPLVTEESLGAALESADGEEYLDRLFGSGPESRDLARHTGNTFLAVFASVQEARARTQPRPHDGRGHGERVRGGLRHGRERSGGRAG